MRTGGIGLLACLLLACASGAAAQETGPPSAAAPDAQAASRPPRLTVTLPADPGVGAPVVRASDVLADGVFAGAMRDGFAVRLQFRLELWRTTSFLDRLVAAYERFDRVGVRVPRRPIPPDR